VSAAEPPTTLPRDEPLKAIALMIGAMFVFSGVDGVSKALAADYHPFLVAWGRFLFQTLLLVPVVLYLGARRVLRTAAPFQQSLRAVCLYGSTIFFVTGLAYLPIAEAAAIGFVSPLFTTALSIPLLGEKVGMRRWAAIMVGFAGVLIVIRPGTAAFHWATAFPVLSSIAWSLALIVTRRMNRQTDQPITTLLYASWVGLVAATLPLPWFWTAPTAGAWGAMVGMAALAGAGHYLLILAFRLGAASILAPFSYSQMVWATLIGYFAFATLPDLWTWIGAAVIILSGVYTWHRERVRHGLVKRA
jgi:drug/metabolite transporter (DMT)-like permease